MRYPPRRAAERGSAMAKCHVVMVCCVPMMGSQCSAVSVQAMAVRAAAMRCGLGFASCARVSCVADRMMAGARVVAIWLMLMWLRMIMAVALTVSMEMAMMPPSLSQLSVTCLGFDAVCVIAMPAAKSMRSIAVTMLFLCAGSVLSYTQRFVFGWGVEYTNNLFCWVLVGLFFGCVG